jgi:hypothetical protein
MNPLSMMKNSHSLKSPILKAKGQKDKSKQTFGFGNLVLKEIKGGAENEQSAS